MKKIYLAGPDVFKDDPISHFKKVKEQLSEIGAEGLSPFDNECNNSREIFLSNIELIKKADLVLANTVPFRGPSVDAGTAFEIGFALALGKPVICYSPDSDTPYKFRVARRGTLEEYPAVEDFNLYDNLMIAHAGPVFLTLEEAINYIRRDLL